MRKIFIVLTLALTFAFAQTSEAQVMRRGVTIVDVGIGLNYAISPFVGIEYGITDKLGPGYLGFGGSASLSFWRGFTALSIGPQLNYHFDFGTFPPRNLDLYLGVGLYYYNWFGNDAPYSPFYPGFHIGARYFFENNLGVTLILGGGLSAGAQLGLSFRL
jgi:outer membrane immunogenic protein